MLNENLTNSEVEVIETSTNETSTNSEVEVNLTSLKETCLNKAIENLKFQVAKNQYSVTTCNFDVLHGYLKIVTNDELKNNDLGLSNVLYDLATNNNYENFTNVETLQKEITKTSLLIEFLEMQYNQLQKNNNDDDLIDDLYSFLKSLYYIQFEQNLFLEHVQTTSNSNNDYSALIKLLEKNNKFNFDLYNQYLIELKEINKISNEKIKNLAINELQRQYNFEADLDNLTSLFDTFFEVLNITNITINSNISENKRLTSFVFNTNKIKQVGEVSEVGEVKNKTSKRFDNETDLINYIRENNNTTSVKVCYKNNSQITEVHLATYKFAIKQALINIGLTSFVGFNIYRACEKM